MNKFVVIPKTNERMKLNNFIHDYGQWLFSQPISIIEQHLAPAETLNALYNITHPQYKVIEKLAKDEL